MKKLLQASLHEVHLKEGGGKWLSARALRAIRRKYRLILKEGYLAYGEQKPRVPVQPKTGAHRKRDVGHNLLRRLHYYEVETLRFLTDPRVPFTNNLAERDLRMAKVKQKILGSFRSFGGPKAFFRIRSFISTARKQGRNAFEALSDIYPASELADEMIPVS